MNDRWLGPWWLWVFAFWFIFAVAVIVGTEATVECDRPCYQTADRP